MFSERAARLMLYIEIMDRETLEAGTMSERNSRQYLAWTNSLRLTLRDLGVKAAPDVVPPSLGDYLATKGGAAMIDIVEALGLCERRSSSRR
jgi:hypothetical protein